MNRRFQALTVAGLLVGTSVEPGGQGSSTDYPQWRGQNRDGEASAFVEPSAWPELLERRWKVDVGEGYATPIVVDGTVYTFTRRDGSEVMTALEATTGAVRWRSFVPSLESRTASKSSRHLIPAGGPKAWRVATIDVGTSG